LLVEGEKVRVQEISSNSWLDVGRPWDLLEANTRALESSKGRVEGKIESNVTLEGKVVVEKDAIVHFGTRIQGPSYIGMGARVGPNSRIRAYTAIGAESVIGASCDVKNSIIMKETEIPHLSYVGDSIIGERCNLGAGTITANLRFDDRPVKVRIRNSIEDSGRRKLGAIIGDGVKTGINVSIFPGVKIGSGSWIEPGCIIRRDIPARTYVTVEQTQTFTRRRCV
jgi:bifunctional UDP-N-acetylglucosamine pyrophosphorylase/glucosamine-1-phosphate N-acetyltransferase